ncbi:MAG: hypothetical protein L6R28_13270 [Planctomycetes bacterium]|nr:hypothetical protein [Planctomycetota bacterium]
MNVVTPKLRQSIDTYLGRWSTYGAYQRNLARVTSESESYHAWLNDVDRWTKDETIEFLNGIWAVNSFGYRLGEIMAANNYKDIRQCFKKLLKPRKSGQARIEAAAIPKIEVATLSEVLCFMQPDTYGIQNKRSTVGLCLASDVGQLVPSAYDPNSTVGATPFSSMPYDEFNVLLADVKHALFAAVEKRWPKEKKQAAKFYCEFGFLVADQLLEHWFIEFKKYLRP